MKSWTWRHVRFSLPDDWEMLRYSRNMETGSCLFADRHRIRLELTWRTVPGPPDFEGMMSDYAARLREKNPDRAPEIRFLPAIGELRGIDVAGEAAHSRFGGYLAAEKCLIETVFFWPTTRDDAILAQALRSLASAPPTPGGLRLWEAGGLALAVEPELDLDFCDFKPAHAEMRFAVSETDRLERRFLRLGMVDHWLKEGLDSWLARQFPRGARIEEQSTRDDRGHRFCRAVGRRRRRRMAFGVNRWMCVQTTAWRCPGDGRVYMSALECLLNKRGVSLAPERALSCCGAWRPGE